MLTQYGVHVGSVEPENITGRQILAQFSYSVRADGKRTSVIETLNYNDDNDSQIEKHTGRVNWFYDNLDWLALHHGAPVGSRVLIPLDLQEMGLPEGMTAQVTANEPCPAIDQGPGRVVLTTVNHLNPRVVELTLQVGTGGPTVPGVGKDSTAGKNRSRSRSASDDLPLETLRPTPLHKFYSQSRGQWLSAEDLQPGEILRGLTGPLEVVSQRPVPGTHRVYNMTVEGEHVYHVSTLGVLAHNTWCAPKPNPNLENYPGAVKYHDTRYPVEKFKTERGVWAETHFTDNKHLTAQEAIDLLGVKPNNVPDRIIVVRDHGQFRASERLLPGGTDWFNPERVPAWDVLGETPIRQPNAT